MDNTSTANTNPRSAGAKRAQVAGSKSNITLLALLAFGLIALLIGGFIFFFTRGDDGVAIPDGWAVHNGEGFKIGYSTDAYPKMYNISAVGGGILSSVDYAQITDATTDFANTQYQLIERDSLTGEDREEFDDIVNGTCPQSFIESGDTDKYESETISVFDISGCVYTAELDTYGFFSDVEVQLTVLTPTEDVAIIFNTSVVGDVDNAEDIFEIPYTFEITDTDKLVDAAAEAESNLQEAIANYVNQSALIDPDSFETVEELESEETDAFSEAASAQRQSHVGEIINAVVQYTSEQGNSIDDLGNIGSCGGVPSIIGTADVDLAESLVPRYLVEIPVDASFGTQEDTGYTICKQQTGRIEVSSTYDSTVSVSR